MILKLKSLKCMKKKPGFSLFSHRPLKAIMAMRFVVLTGLMSVMLLIASQSSYAINGSSSLNEEIASQQVKVTGTITDASTGEALVGVNVVLEGSTVGVMTDINGKYSIPVPNLKGVLQISYIGYVTQKVQINGMAVVDVALSSDIQTLSEIVVVGYGQQRKSDITGSISSVKGRELVQLPLQRVDQALQGRAAGVLVLNTAGAPGALTTIRVRGMNSINGGNNALIVVDGLQGANLNSINPNDIESIEILKDASATAIYGSRGANGVILITTKTGKKGKPVIDYSFSYGSQTIRHKLDLMDAADYARTRNAYKATQNASGTPVPWFTDAQISNLEKTGGTDWQDEIYRTAPISNHQLTISGGTDNMKYMVSGGYLDQQGILVNSGYKRFTLRTNVSADINKVVSFGLNWSGAKEAGNSPPYGGGTALSFLGQAVNIAPRWDPTTPPYDAEGNYSRHPQGYGAYDTWNPLAAALEPDIMNNTVRNSINTNLDFKIIEGLKLRITGGATIQNDNNKSYYNSKTWEGKPIGGKVGYATIDNGLYSFYQNSNILTYDKNIGSLHHLTAMIVAEQQYSKSETNGLVASKFTVDQTGVNDLGGAEQINSKASNVTERVLNSYLGRINYAFANKYLVTVSYRADGSAVFGENTKWGYFPSGSLAWKLKEESFINDLNIFSELKLRGSWGIIGNQAIAPYQTISSMSSGNNYPYSGNDGTDLGFIIANPPNPNLKWESTTQSNIGLDFAVFKGRLTATVDIYKKTTKDLLLNKTLPGYTGFSSIIANVGSVENKGLEISIGGDPLVGEVKWNSGFNISWNRNKVLNLGETSRLEFKTTYGGYNLKTGFMQLRVGEPFGQMYGYGYEGTWKTSEATEAAAFGQLPGDPKYTDFNKDGKINSSDVMIIGNAIPDFIFGWTNRVSYKNFELTLLIQGSKGNDIFNQGRIRLENPFEGTSSRMLDRWTNTNQDTDVPAFIDAVTRQNAGLASKVSLGSDGGRLQRYVEDGSYIRLKNVTLGYTLPETVTGKIGFSKLRAYISGTNLITLTKYTGYDPEVSAYNSNDAQIGVDLSNYPTARTITFGIDVTF
jgi:TonB-dependent starch-binding outer membrane protein SusC